MWCGNKRASLIMKKLLLKGRKNPYFSLLYSKPSLRLRTEPFFCDWKMTPSWIEMLQLHPQAALSSVYLPSLKIMIQNRS